MDNAHRATTGANELRRLSLGMIALSFIQYLLGMALNLFVVITRHHPGTHGSDYFSRAFQSVLWAISHGGLLAFHVGVGILLFLGSVRLAVATFTAHGPRVRTAGVLGALAVLGAGFNGASFLSFNENFSSMIMASAFAVAVLSYSWIVYRTAAPVAEGLASAS